jgi:hypothetical protein
MSLPDALTTIALSLVASSVVLGGSAIVCCKMIIHGRQNSKDTREP